MCRHLQSLLLLCFTLVILPALVKANDFAGANSYFLYAVSVSALVVCDSVRTDRRVTQDSDRIAVLDAMQSANMKR